MKLDLVAGNLGVSQSAGKYRRYADETYGRWGEPEALTYGLRKKYKPVAIVGQDNLVSLVLFELNDYDAKQVAHIRLKSGEKIYRFSSKRVAAGDMFPLVKVNLDRGLMYFLTEAASSGETDEIVFQTRGVKLAFARTLPGVQ